MIKKLSLALTVILMGAMQTNAQSGNFTKLNSSIEYRIVKDVPGKKAEIGSMVTMHIKTMVNENALFDSYAMNNNEPVPAQIAKPQYNGDVMEGLAMLSAGDSAIFRTPADSIFRGGQMQPGVKSGDIVYFYVKMVSVKSKAEFDKEQLEKSAKQKGIDEKLLTDYIAKNKLKVQKTASGIYYVISSKGNGKHATAADKVKVHYKGYKLNGETFDSSYDRGEPIEFPLGGVIKGWTEGIPMLEEGGKGTLLIPSHLAYGANGPAGSKIGPNEVLLFDVELLEINPKPVASPQEAKDDKLIQDYIKKNNLKTQKTPSGIYYVIDKKGNGKHPTAADKVKVHYKGYKLSGETFDSSYDRGQPIEFPLSGVIKGWTEGIPMFEEGGKGTLLIPSHLAYGQNAPGGSIIGPNEVLLFDVELLEINSANK
jgi:FKBP-type peptidyl-prolyl cis-trans isomerase